MDSPKKEELSARYEANNSLRKDDDDRSCYSTAHKTGQKPALNCSPTPYSKTHPPRVTVYPPLFPARKEDELDSDFNRNSERHSEDQHSDRSSSYFLAVGREREEKAAGSYKNYHYIQFYKRQYAKLVHEHAKWTAAQISQIIKLQWKHTRSLAKDNTTTKRKTRKVLKLLSGKIFFRRIHAEKFMTYFDCKNAWKRLPFESKRLYVKRGQGMTEADERLLNKETFQVRVTKTGLSPMQLLRKGF
jgi:hypothetical protein